MKTFKEFMSEDTTTTGIGGLGFVSGTPAVNQAGVANYVSQNTVDSDQKNNILGLKDHTTKYNLVKFNAFDPKELKEKPKKHK